MMDIPSRRYDWLIFKYVYVVTDRSYLPIILPIILPMISTYNHYTLSIANRFA